MYLQKKMYTLPTSNQQELDEAIRALPILMKCRTLSTKTKPSKLPEKEIKRDHLLGDNGQIEIKFT